MKKSHLFVLTAAGLLLSGAAMAADQCSAEITGNDVMQYDKKEITIPASCKDFTVTLKHIGKMPKTTMGHNWVLTKAADEQTVVKDGMAAGIAKDFIPGDAQIIAHTKLVGGGESDSVTFPVSKLQASEKYVFFCTFPGHAGMMHGTIDIK